MGFQVGVDIEGVESVLAGFRELSLGLQKKYLGAAVGEAAKSEIASLRAATPRGPGGALRRSVGVRVEKTIVKPWEVGGGKRGGKAVARIGYRRGKTQKGKQFGGNHAWWIEEGVAARTPAKSAFSIPVKNTRKYGYLKPMAVSVDGGGSAVFLRRIAAKRGIKMFEQWSQTALPAIMRKLQGSLGTYLQKARDEAARRAARAGARKAARSR